MIYLQGGGSCANKFTCSLNPANLAATEGLFREEGLLNRNNPLNPVKDWSFVYVPYCTGDVHSGDNPGADPGDGTGPQQFVGFKNMQIFLEHVKTLVPKVKRVLHTGSSAGGFGAGLTSDLVASHFPSGTRFVLLDDAGPPMAQQYLAACLQQQWRTLWGFDKSFLTTCGEHCTDPDNFAMEWPVHLIKKNPNSYGGIISGTEDAVIRLFYGFGADDCSPDPTKPPVPMTPAQFSAGLVSMREQLRPLSSTFGTYFIPSATHTWLTKDSDFYETEVGGVKLVDWVRDLIDEKAAPHVGP